MSVTNSTNLQTLDIARQLGLTQTMLTRSMNRLSSGNKISDPGDDSAGLATADKLDSQNLRAQAASTNVQNAVSFVQTMDGFMGNMTQILTRMSELAADAKDPTKNSSDIAQYQDEFSALQDQLRATVGGDTSTLGGQTGVTSPLGSFNGTALFEASTTNLTVTIGKNAGETMPISGANFQQGAMLDLIHQDPTGAYDISVTDPGAIDSINSALDQTATARASVAGMQSRLDIAATQLAVESQNLTSAISDIRDVDVASESTQLAKYNILMQAGTAMLSQANQTPAAVLKLLQQ